MVGRVYFVMLLLEWLIKVHHKIGVYVCEWNAKQQQCICWMLTQFGVAEFSYRWLQKDICIGIGFYRVNSNMHYISAIVALSMNRSTEI